MTTQQVVLTALILYSLVIANLATAMYSCKDIEHLKTLGFKFTIFSLAIGIIFSVVTYLTLGLM